MPQIVVHVAAYYDWRPAPPEAVPEDPAELVSAILALRIKPASVPGDGPAKYLQKVQVDTESHTVVNLPESEIEAFDRYFKGKGIAMSRNKLVERYLQEITMPHHAHPDHFLKIEVHDDPELERFLNHAFECDAAEPAAPAGGAQ